MPENILVVEYEPRYTDRVKQALTGQPFEAWLAKDGEEALRLLDGGAPRLIVLSSVVPKISTSDLIRAIRGRDALKRTPILLTVSGYRGDSPRADAARLGASDILPKPYSENEFLSKVQQMLGVASVAWSPQLDSDLTVRMTAPTAATSGGLTSNEIFGELLDDDRATSNAARKPMNPKDDVDKMLADTLAGMMPQQKKTVKDTPLPQVPTPATPPPPPPVTPALPVTQTAQTAQTPKSRPSSPALDKRFQDTLSGLEKNARRTSPGTTPAPAPTVITPLPPRPAAPQPPPAVPLARSSSETIRVPIPPVDRVPIAQPVFPPTVPMPHPEDDEPSDGTKFGQYVMLEKIATGGMAEVWKARMRGVEGFQKIVAIKKILPHLSDNQDFIEMFVDEAKLAAQLNHNNIIHIYDLGKIQSSYYIAMEYIDGYDLKNILRKAQERDQPLSVEIALFVASKIAAALDYAHRKRDFEDKEMGLVHRDVSPQNVLISEEGDIKLCDFGIAKAASKASHTQAGALKGKLQYMSPEQAWGRNIDRRSDIFALATVLFEMLTARKLFGGDNELSILEQVREARVTPPSEYNDEVTPQIDSIVLKALQKDPANRYQTAGEMQRDLDAVLYSFRPTPTSADLAIYMHRLATSTAVEPHQIEAMPEPAPAANELRPLKPVTVTTPSSMPAAMPVAATAPASAAKKPPIVPIAIAAAVVIAVIAGFLMMRKPATTTVTPAKNPIVSKPAVATTTAGSVIATGTTNAAASTSTAIDPSKVNEEVQKRLAAEKARLDQLARAQNQQPATSTQRAAAPAPTPQPQVAQNVPPPVVENRPAPAPQPAAPAPQPVAESRPAPQPEAPRTQVGDLVAQGSEGLTPARMARQALAQYPPLARVQHMQGSVIVSALVNENGQVIDTRVIRSVSPILNNAAVDSIRRSTFTPGTKDGVRVKSWTTVSVDFKL
ncbi:MAG: eukaryotic-like serine/threonine-protein kinase [Thermoanaerobaculia bacterium]|jgi:TonB family protein|nr:eukaryotic-like serine/threonine-protein kinase [Thermoanaerobaculia bacterium]